MSAAIYRTAVFLFSIVCYGAFLLVFLYLLALPRQPAGNAAGRCLPGDADARVAIHRSGTRHGFAASPRCWWMSA